jgi:hypothetical protein
MKNLLILALALAGLTACKKENPAKTNDTKPVATAEALTTPPANITLTAGGEQYKITGSCGWAEAMDNHYIGASDSSNNLKTFSTYFNIKELPSETTTYTLVANQNDKDPSHIWMNITEIRDKGMLSYNSDDSSGKLTLKVDGKNISVDLAGIVLKPMTDSGVFTNLNVGAFSSPGTLSGSLNFTKE